MTLPRLILLLLLLPLSFLMAEQNASFEYGLSPPTPIFDPSGFLTPDQTAKIVTPLESIRANEGVDIIVVVLPDLGGTPPEYVAEQFASAWCHTDVHAIVLYSPGKNPILSIFPGGRVLQLIKRPVIDKAISDAQRRALREPYESEKIRAASNEAADLLRLWTGSTITHSEDLQTARDSWYLSRSAAQLHWKYLLLGIGCIFIPCILLIWYLVNRYRQRGPKIFPEPSITRRLGAPYSGGNSARIDLESSSGRS